MAIRNILTNLYKKRHVALTLENLQKLKKKKTLFLQKNFISPFHGEPDIFKALQSRPKYFFFKIYENQRNLTSAI